MSWKCKCGLLNSGLNNQCAARLTDNSIEHYQISTNSLDELRIYVALNGVKSMREMTDSEKLFAEYYSRSRILVKDMDDAQLREHYEELSQIATQAKASQQGASDEIRERTAKKKTKDKEWLVTTDTSQATREAINTVKTRTARMSKIDKIREQLRNIPGMSEEAIKEMVANMERTATESQMKTVTFKKSSVETAAVQVQVDKTDVKEVKPFDPSKLFGKKSTE